MIKKVLFIGVCIFAFASCSTVKPLYSWYNYEILLISTARRARKNFR